MSRLSGCKPTLHIPVEQEHVGEKPGFLWEVVAILVVRIPYQAKQALNLCRRYWEIYQNLGSFCQNTRLLIPKSDKVTVVSNGNTLYVTILPPLTHELWVSKW